MTTADIIAQIRSALVEPVEGFWTDEELIRWMNRGQSDFVNRTRCLEDKDVSTTEGGVGIYPLPSNCLSVSAIFINTAQRTETTPNPAPNWQRLIPTNLEKNAQQAPNFTSTNSSQTGDPSSYMIWGRSLYLFPVPRTPVLPQLAPSDNLLLFFKSKPLDIESSNQPLGLDDSLHEALIAYVLWRAYEKEKEFEQAVYQRSIYEGYIQQGLRWVKKQSGDQKYKIDIQSPTPFNGPFDNRFNPLA